MAAVFAIRLRQVEQLNGSRIAAQLAEDTRIEMHVPVVQCQTLARVEFRYRPLACTEKGAWNFSEQQKHEQK